MCVTVYQSAGYLVPFKKVQIARRKHDNFNELFRDIKIWNYKDDQRIFVIHQNESTCECGDENGDGRKFERDTFHPLSYDEDDMVLYEENKKALLSRLEQVGLGKYAIYGVYTDAEIEGH